MAKKQIGVSLRKPPPPAELDTFVHEATRGGGELPVAPLPKTEVVLRSRAGGELREVVVLLSEAVARRLSAFCREKDLDASKVVEEALLKHLEMVEAAPVAAPAPRQTIVELPWWSFQKILAVLRTRFAFG